MSEGRRASRVLQCFAALPYREQRVLMLRFGMGSEDATTLEAIGAIFSVTRERVRQIEAMALRKLEQEVFQDETIMINDFIRWSAEDEDVNVNGFSDDAIKRFLAWRRI